MLSRFNLSICGLLRIYALVAELLIKTVYSYLELIRINTLKSP